MGQTKKTITRKQSIKIHTLKGKLGLTDEEYRLRLTDYWVPSCKDLTYNEANDFINKLTAEAISKGVWKSYTGKKKYDDLGKRKGFASPRQLRMIEAMWKDVSYTHDAGKRQTALRRFLFRIAGVDDLKFLPSDKVQKIINALQHMKERRGKR
jgi:uncharacterized protein (DUF2267 family)